MKAAIPVLIQIWRLFVIVAIVWMVRQQHVRALVQGERPITISEAREFLPETHNLKPDAGPRRGLTVLNREGQPIGYVARTMPQSREIIGYSGPTDALMVFGADKKLVGIAIRHSYDTPSHVEDVKLDLLFMETWNGRTWDEIAGLQDLRASKIYGVSGATRTSEALAQSVALRAAAAGGKIAAKNQFRLDWQDAGLILVVLSGLALAFVKRPWLQRRKLWVSIAIFVYLGLVSGDLLAQALLVGWAETGLPWRVTPGLVLLAAAAFFVPLTARHPVYCTHLCPHGHAQRWLMKVIPARWKLGLHADIKWGLRALPPLLIAVVLLTTFLNLPLDLAGIEPFDAYLIASAGLATTVVAVVSLLVSIFIPMAYCKYGCPTGWLLEFVRVDRFGPKDATGAALLALAALLYFGNDWVTALLIG